SADKELTVARVIPDALNASLVGAKTVNGPLPSRVAAKPALITAAFKIEKLGVLETIIVIVPVCGISSFFFLHEAEVNNNIKETANNGSSRDENFVLMII